MNPPNQSGSSSYALIIPWSPTPSPPPPSPLSTSLDINYHNRTKNDQSRYLTRRYWFLIWLSSLCLVFMVAITVIVPFLISLSSFDNESTSTSSTSTLTNIISLRWNRTGITVAGITGVAGSASYQMSAPFGLILDSSDTLYIADAYNNRVQKYFQGASNGNTVAGQINATSGLSASQLNRPFDVAVDSNGNVYVADTINHRIQLWLNGSSAGTTVVGTGVPGNSSNRLNTPYGITYDSSSGKIYISDTNNHRIMSYSLGASSGTVVAGGNGAGINTTQLYFPRGLYFDSSTNSLLIANTVANNIVRWNLGASYWTLVAGNMNGLSNNTSTTLNQPYDVTLDSMGNIYVADTFNYRIQFFLSGQFNGTTIAGVTGVSGSNATLLSAPTSLALDTQLNLYVSDTQNHRIQKFQRY